MRGLRFFFLMKQSRERHDSLLSRSLWLRHSLSYLPLKMLSADLVRLLVLAGNATGTGSVEETDETHEEAALPSPFIGRSQTLSGPGGAKAVQFCSRNDRIVTHLECHDAANASLLIFTLTVSNGCERIEVDHNGFSFDAILQAGSGRNRLLFLLFGCCRKVIGGFRITQGLNCQHYYDNILIILGGSPPFYSDRKRSRTS
jgi:hypothetical protein